MTIISPKAVALQIAIERPSDCTWLRYPTIVGNSEERAADRAQIGTSHLFAAFRGPHFWTTVKVQRSSECRDVGYALSVILGPSR
ncbi:MAG TPA: hypothetical protein VEQ62_19770 [Stellaceae bacterium]|nr:hypothetical protein [Stellaceae bacterium]